MKAKLILSIALLMGIAVSSVQAQSIADRERYQRERITEGYRNGSLNRGEAYRLSREQQKIRHDYRRYKWNDGRLSRHERRKLHREQQRASRHIYWHKHHGRHRFD